MAETIEILDTSTIPVIINFIILFKMFSIFKSPH